ncbi:MAG: signal peptidase II [Bacilli bacterium]|jgi:signal peptidase II|nr:signal peptidase II [Bacilli bacterium]MDY0064022.1 signal peptidase II [Bacilli bacterium]
MKKFDIKKYYSAFLIIGIGILFDQITKILATAFIKDNPITVIPNFFSLDYLKNNGAAFGILQGQLWFFLVITVIALGVFVYMMKDFNLKEHKWYSIALLLIFSGTLGNLIDRVLHIHLTADGYTTYVIDFLHFHFFAPHFNFADAYLTIGVAILIIDILFGKSGKILK